MDSIRLFLYMKLNVIHCALMVLFVFSCGDSAPVRPSPKKPVEPPLVGLPNLNNTCFANASINLLFSATLVKNALMEPLKQSNESAEAFLARSQFQKATKDLFLARQKGETKICNQLNAFYDAFEKTRKIIKGSELIGNIDKIRVSQADAHEFMTDILEFLDVKGPRLFTYYKFLDGTVKISNLEPQTMLSVPLSNNTIKDIIANWMVPELMAGANQFELSPGVKVDAYRHEAFENPLPTSLIVHLIRHSIDSAGVAHRLSNVVQPDKLLTLTAGDYKDISKTYKQNYSLKGIIIHIGSTPQSGHYYAYIFDAVKNHWILFNDSVASIVTEAVVMNDAIKNGYIFLYEKI